MNATAVDHDDEVNVNGELTSDSPVPKKDAATKIKELLKGEEGVQTTISQKKDADNVLLARPTVRSILLLITGIIMIDSIFSLILGFRANSSLFWQMLNPDNYEPSEYEDGHFNLRLFVFWSLGSIGMVGLILCYSTYGLLKDPQALFRYFGASCSFIQAILLVGIGITGLY